MDNLILPELERWKLKYIKTNIDLENFKKLLSAKHLYHPLEEVDDEGFTEFTYTLTDFQLHGFHKHPKEWDEFIVNCLVNYLSEQFKGQGWTIVEFGFGGNIELNPPTIRIQGYAYVGE